MQTSGEIEQQRELLATYRRTVAQLLRQAAVYGGETLAPPLITNSLYEARRNIWKIKAALRSWDVAVADLPGDEAVVDLPGDEAVADLSGDEEVADLPDDEVPSNLASLPPHWARPGLLAVLGAGALIVLAVLIVLIRQPGPAVGAPTAAAALPSTVAEPNAGPTPRSTPPTTGTATSVDQAVLLNADFQQGTAGWAQVIDTESAAGQMSNRDGELCAEITKPGGWPWSYIMYHIALPLKNHTDYELHFKAHADSLTSMQLRLHSSQSSDPDRYYNRPVSLSTVATDYQIPFSVTDENTPDLLIEFQVGGVGPGTICVDNIILREKAQA